MEIYRLYLRKSGIYVTLILKSALLVYPIFGINVDLTYSNLFTNKCLHIFYTLFKSLQSLIDTVCFSSILINKSSCTIYYYCSKSIRYGCCVCCCRHICWKRKKSYFKLNPFVGKGYNKKLLSGVLDTYWAHHLVQTVLLVCHTTMCSCCCII